MKVVSTAQESAERGESVLGVYFIRGRGRSDVYRVYQVGGGLLGDRGLSLQSELDRWRQYRQMMDMMLQQQSQANYQPTTGSVQWVDPQPWNSNQLSSWGKIRGSK